MKKFIALAAFVIFGTVTGFSQFKFGAGANLIFDGSVLGVGARGHYTVNEDFAGQASFNLLLEDGAAWSLDLDVHYSGFDIGDVESFSLTPFAGINIYRTSSVTFLGQTVGGESFTGLNIGINGTMSLTESLDLYIEPKFIIGDVGSFAIAAGVYF